MSAPITYTFEAVGRAYGADVLSRSAPRERGVLYFRARSTAERPRRDDPHPDCQLPIPAEIARHVRPGAIVRVTVEVTQ